MQSFAQQLAADAFGAAQALFSTNGSTLSVQIAVLATTHPGQEVAVARGERPGLDAKKFHDEHASQGHRFLDLNIGPNSEHGATTHLIQELAVDRALRDAGYPMRSEQFRELLGGVVGEPHANRPLGDRLWRALYDGEFERAINEPESLFPVLEKVLPGLT